MIILSARHKECVVYDGEYVQLDDQVHVGHVATAGLTVISVTGL